MTRHPPRIMPERGGIAVQENTGVHPPVALGYADA